MKESISMLQEFISLQKNIEKEYGRIRLNEMQEHFYIRICEKANDVIHKSPDASFKQTVSYLYKQLLDCKPDNTKFVNGYAHLINEPRNFEAEYFDVVHAYRTLEQHEPLETRYKKLKNICMMWTLGAIDKDTPSNELEWRTCEHYLLKSGIGYLKKALCILKKFSQGEDLVLEAWFRYQKQDITIYHAESVLEKIKSDFDYEFDTEKYYRHNQKEFRKSLKFIDWKSNDIDRQIYECFLQVVFNVPPKRKLLVQPGEIKEKYGIDDKKQLEKIMKQVSKLCKEKPELGREEVWEYIESMRQNSK